LIAVFSQSLIPTTDGKGRVAAFEIMHTTPAIQNLIRENKTHQISSSIQTSKNMGMITMDDAIFKLFMDGKIDSTQAVEFAQDPDTLRKKLF
ncbi:MAG: type IV pili twitching motility protein PilT, partial [Lachnospiraceae bacterium]|nr:type IV pili twitching motility protein PilT [Lachnospiraceae bacterium]